MIEPGYSPPYYGGRRRRPPRKRRGPHGRRTRRAGRRVLGALLVLCLAGLAIALSGALGGGARRGEGDRAADVLGISGAYNPDPPRSPAGLPLGRPALDLAGLGDPAADEIRQRFIRPPRAGVLFDLDDDRVLWQLHPMRRAPIASLTKMMTALVVAHDSRPDELVRITRAASEMPGSRVGVLPLNRRVPLEALLYGLLLPSGNDAAVALAEHVAGSVGRFVAMMNAEAARLGLGCTRYSNPSGYYNAGNFSCAADLATLADEDLEQPRIARIVRSASAVVPFPIKGGRLYLVNNNPLLLYGYRGADGVKTGYTEAAGPCLVASATRHGVHLGLVLLDSPAPGTQAQRLFDDAFQQVYHQRPLPEPVIPGGA